MALPARRSRIALTARLLVCCAVLGGCASPVTPVRTATPSGPRSQPASGHRPVPRARKPAARAVSVRVTAAPWHLPAPLSREVALAVGGGVELVGGLTSGGTSSAAVLLLDPRTGATRPWGRLAVPAHDAAGAVLGSGQYLFGGGASSTEATVQRLRPGVAAARTGVLPQARSDLVAVTVGPAAYLLGGYDGTAWASTVLRTTDAATFTRVAALPVPVRYPAVAVLGRDIWVFGGQSASGPSAVIQRIDVTTGRAEVVGRMPAALTEASALVLGGQIYLCGGLTASGATNAVSRFDPVTRRLVVVAHLPAPVHDAGSVVSGGVGYLLGGENPDPTSQVAVVQVVASASGAARTP